MDNRSLTTSYDNRFFDNYLGSKISHDPITAIVELIANSWDAGAENVRIYWVAGVGGSFSIADDGHGLNNEEFSDRWTKLSYDRRKTQGNSVEIPSDNQINNNRIAYGRNGKGRFAGFCFGDNQYYVEIKKGDTHSCYKIEKTSGHDPLKYSPIEKQYESKLFNKSHGVAVYSEIKNHIGIPEHKIKSEIGLRFLIDPYFKVFINDKPITFSDINSEQTERIIFNFKEHDYIIRVLHTKNSDKTINQHGIAWLSNNRLIGKFNWKDINDIEILDGRTSFAKQYTFIVDSSALVENIKDDWSGFDIDDDVKEFNDLVVKKIKEFISDTTTQKREEISRKIKQEVEKELRTINPIAMDIWTKFVDDIQKECPTLSENELHSIAKILANLEASSSQYSLIYQLEKCDPDDLDSLNQILKDWSIKSAKSVLDEIQKRLVLIDQLKRKIHDPDTKEVQDLQPLFSQGLWIFGPEYESIEFTSNQGMNKIIQDLLRVDKKGSQNRPDFVVSIDSTVGLYGCYEYDNDGGEKGIKKLVIVELKRPGILLGNEEKQQCWKYAKELYKTGAILQNCKVQCYLLGEKIDNHEGGSLIEKNESVIITPLIYDTVIKRAETRLLNLHKKIENEPFLNKDIKNFIKDNTIQKGLEV